MNSLSEINIYSTASAKTCFIYLSSFQEKAKMMIKGRYWNTSISQGGNIFCSDKLPSSYHHFGAFVKDLFPVILAQRSLCWYNGFLTGCSQTTLSHQHFSIREYNQNSSLWKDPTETGSKWHSHLKKKKNHWSHLFPFLSFPPNTQLQYFEAIPPTHHIWVGSTPSLHIRSLPTPTYELIIDNQEPTPALTHHIRTNTHPLHQTALSSSLQSRTSFLTTLEVYFWV